MVHYNNYVQESRIILELRMKIGNLPENGSTNRNTGCRAVKSVTIRPSGLKKMLNCSDGAEIYGGWSMFQRLVEPSLHG